jgi:hypothetical protein
VVDSGICELSLPGRIDAELKSRGIDPDRAVPGSRRLKHVGVTVFILEQREEERPFEADDCGGDVPQDAPATRKRSAASIYGEMGEKTVSRILSKRDRCRRELAFKDFSLVDLLPANVLKNSPFQHIEMQHDHSIVYAGFVAIAKKPALVEASLSLIVLQSEQRPSRGAIRRSCGARSPFRLA